ncbi:MAG: phosphatase PAP2 family protein [Cyclobacteriaceae bacterium]
MRFFQDRALPLIFFWITACLVSANATAQDKVYELDSKKEVPILSAGTAGTVTSLILRDKREPLQTANFSMLDPDRLLGIDRTAINNYNESARLASDIFLNASYLFPLTALAFQDARSEFGTISVMMLETILLNETFTGLTKTLVSRPRPFTFNEDVPEAIRTEKGNNFSFFSGHTSYTAAISFFSAQVLTEYIENPTTRKLIWAGAIVWPAATGYFRYAAGKHYITDVITGYTVGALIGYFIPKLHEIGEAEKEKTSGFMLKPGSSPQQMFTLVFVF